MKRPFVTLDMYNLLFYMGVGGAWFITGVLSLIDDIRAVKFIIIAIDLLLISLLLYTSIGKREKNDEMTYSYFEKARSIGFYMGTIACMILISINIIYDGCIPFKFGGPVTLGIAYMSTGWTFRQLEQSGD